MSRSDRLSPIANERFSELSPSERVFILIWDLEAEVNNGGFNQFFFNSAGDRASATPAALRAIGRSRSAEPRRGLDAHARHGRRRGPLTH